jgi:hypothetical protein
MWQLVAFEFSCDEFIVIDFDRLGRRRVSRPVGLRNQLVIVSATVNLNWVNFPSLVGICNLALSIPDDFSFLGVPTGLGQIGHWN